MGWIYFQELQGLPSHLTNGSNQLPIAKSIDIVNLSCYQEWLNKQSSKPLFGTTLKLFPQLNSLDTSTLSMVDSHVRTLALQEMEKAWRVSEAAYFTRSLGCVAKLSQDLSFWKTYLPLLPEEEQKWLEKLPRWGMIVDGALYRLRQSERYTKEKGGSYWPTPQARAQTDTPSERRRHSPCLETIVKLLPTPDASARGARKNQNGHTFNLQDAVGSGKLNPLWVELLMGYPPGWTKII